MYRVRGSYLSHWLILQSRCGQCRKPPPQSNRLGEGAIRFSVRRATAYLLAALLVASCSGVPVNSQQSIEIRLSSSLDACFIADVEVSCNDVGAKLLAMNVPLNSRIHCVGDSVVSYELVHSTLESLGRAGYSTKVGFLTD